MVRACSLGREMGTLKAAARELKDVFARPHERISDKDAQGVARPDQDMRYSDSEVCKVIVETTIVLKSLCPKGQTRHLQCSPAFVRPTSMDYSLNS